MKTKPFSISELKKSSELSLDEVTTKQMFKCLDTLTTSGNETLDETELKKFKKFCRKSDDQVRYAFLLIMRQLERKHSEIRLSAFQVAAEIFTRSHAFREILVAHLQEFLTLTTGTETNKPLPPPKYAADKLKESTIRTVQHWYETYGKSYRKLDYGYNYLKNCKHIDFRNIIARNQAESLRIEQERKRKEKQMADRLAKVLQVIAENRPEMEDCIKEAENCLKLLLPTPENFQLFTEEDVTPSNTLESELEKIKSQSLSLPSINCKGGETDNVKGNNIAVADNLGGESAKNNSEPSSEEVDSEDKNGDSLKTDNKCDLDCRTDEGKLDTGKEVSNSGDAEESQTDQEDEIESENEDGFCSDEFDAERAHGFGIPGVSINIEIPVESLSVKETEDNADVLQSLKDAAKLVTGVFLPRVTKWLEDKKMIQISDPLSKIQSNSDSIKIALDLKTMMLIKRENVLGKTGGHQNDIKSIIDLKLSLESIKTKCSELKLVLVEKQGGRNSEGEEEEEEDDDDFEDVPEKEGYEYEAILVEPAVDQGHSSQSHVEEKPALKRRHTGEPSASSNSDFKCVSVKKSKSLTTPHWNLKERKKVDAVSDPTSLASALARIQSSTSSEDVQPPTSAIVATTQTAGESSKSAHPAPFVQFGAELAHWGNEDKIEAPEIVKLESLHTFWASSEKDPEGSTKQQVQLMLNRTYKFTGEFEPVKWSCRAPLKNGKLCPRMDRLKCPFHGRIIPRDEAGNPAVKDEPGTSTASTSHVDARADAEDYSELPPWRDPELQREIEHATGHDLGSARSQKLLDQAALKKGKGKGKGKKKSGLTDIREASNTSRNRLEKIVFNKRSMRRVCSTMDTSDYKRVRDKFGNQFNYN